MLTTEPLIGYTTKSLTGFNMSTLKPGEIFENEHKEYNHLFFLIKGKAIISNLETIGYIINTGDFFFIPISSEILCEAVYPCDIIIFSYPDEYYSIYEQDYFRGLWKLSGAMDYSFEPIRMNPPISLFMDGFKDYFKYRLDQTEISKFKQEEFFCLLTLSYPKEKIVSLFYPAIGKSLEFRRFIFENYLKVKNVEELIQLCDATRKTFDRQFLDEFGVSAYQWILSQRAKHVRFSLAETDDKMKIIMERYGFTIASHFTRFCWEQFDYAPLKFRKHLKEKKNLTLERCKLILD